jgi:hypothetical protein
MALDRVPWFIGGGAEHSPETARNILYDATAGANGVAGSSDLKVAALAVPGSGVRVMPGGALLRSRYAGAAAQSYALRNPTATDVPIRPTGSSGKRSDAIVARVLDPQYEGQAPTDPNDYDYARFTVIEGVSPTLSTDAELIASHGITYPFTLLARVDLPASRADVQPGFVKDLRKLGNPQRQRALQSAYVGARSEITRTGNYGTLRSFTVEVPEWATHAIVVASVQGAYTKGGPGTGHVAITGFGQSALNHTSPWDMDVSSDRFERHYFEASGELPISAAYRGGTHPIVLVARTDPSSTAGTVFGVDGKSRCKLDVEFVQGLE